jgi:D-glutamate N-acetyltransferase
VVGISINTQHLSEEDARAYLAEVEARMGLPTVDPYRHGAGRLVDALAAV